MRAKVGKDEGRRRENMRAVVGGNNTFDGKINMKNIRFVKY